MSSPRVMIMPDVCEQGEAAALAGTHLSSTEAPLGFTFNPYKPSQVTQRWNFLSGCVEAYFGNSLPRGEQSRWHRP